MPGPVRSSGAFASRETVYRTGDLSWCQHEIGRGWFNLGDRNGGGRRCGGTAVLLQRTGHSTDEQPGRSTKPIDLNVSLG